MRKLLIAAGAAALMAACTSAAGAQGAPEDGHGGRHAGMLFQADANNDGVLTRQEFDAGHAAKFARMDANSDGSVSADEQRAAHRAMSEQMREHHGEDRAERRETHWNQQDANSDGAVSREEFLSRPNQAFDRMDANRDGNLSADERPQPRERGEHGQRGERHGGFHGGDANNDGALSRAEFDAHGASMFQMLDANSDGRVTREEAEAARPHRHGAPT